MLFDSSFGNKGGSHISKGVRRSSQDVTFLHGGRGSSEARKNLEGGLLCSGSLSGLCIPTVNSNKPLIILGIAKNYYEPFS